MLPQRLLTRPLSCSHRPCHFCCVPVAMTPPLSQEKRGAVAMRLLPSVVQEPNRLPECSRLRRGLPPSLVVQSSTTPLTSGTHSGGSARVIASRSSPIKAPTASPRSFFTSSASGLLSSSSLREGASVCPLPA